MLIVDDDADVRRVVLGILRPLCEILEASNGKDALRLLSAEKPSLMLLDMTMPEMSGLDVWKEARAFDPALPIVMLTGDSDLGSAKCALDDGARAYITKPFAPETLYEDVRRILAGSEGAEESSGRPWRVRS